MGKSLKILDINTKFCRTEEERLKIKRALQRFEFLDCGIHSGTYNKQLSCMYDAQSDWKYEPGKDVLGSIGKSNYHIIIARPINNKDLVAGTVRAVYFPNSNLVYGSCLVINPQFRNEGLSLPLIYTAMSVSDQDSQHCEKVGIDGAVLGVDDNPKMRAFHSIWGVRFIHKNHIPFITPKFALRSETTRIMGFRLSQDIQLVCAQMVKLILSDLMAFQFEIGYSIKSTESVHAQMQKRIQKEAVFRLLSAEEYGSCGYS